MQRIFVLVSKNIITVTTVFLKINFLYFVTILLLAFKKFDLNYDTLVPVTQRLRGNKNTTQDFRAGRMKLRLDEFRYMGFTDKTTDIHILGF